MEKIKCIIIEDEKPAQEVLKSLIGRVDFLELKATFDDALAALDYLKHHEVDVLFLDIQIPSLNGIGFLKILKNPPQVIITSAYSNYALEAFDLDVRDFLAKPISFERFLKAVNRISLNPDAKAIHQFSNSSPRGNAFAFFNVNKVMVKVEFVNILYIESMREYVYIHTGSNKVITKIGISEMEKMLPKNFIRVHRSFIANLNKISAYTAEEIFIGKHSLPIGTSYKKLVENTLHKVN
ncbi:MAG: LytTR family DNA-binding domain-containing protein [Cyclobacteriaceae bacterium]|nr:LytTR family DNA-binding domain-containing protein [Cyclobacteriaceae bacterium]